MNGARGPLRRASFVAATASLLLVAIGPSLAAAAPQTFDTALPVAKGNFVLREQFLALEASDDPSPADRELEIFGLVSVLGYGLTSDLASFGVLPVLDKKLGLRLPNGQRLTRSTSGLGDARIFARYTALQRDARGRSFRLAPFIGIELPTGDDGADDRLGRLPRPLQLGSGSWDPFGGLIATYQTLAYQVDAQLSYQINTEADGFELGDELRLDASWQYRLWPRELGDVAGWIAFVPSPRERPYEFMQAWGEKGAEPGQFDDPTGLAVAGGEVFVADSRNGRIQVFGVDGTPKRIIGGSGSGPGRFDAPVGVAVDQSGALFVADFYGHRVRQLTPDGTFIRQWGTTGQPGHAPGRFYYPTDVALDRAGRLYVADGYGHRIQVFDPNDPNGAPLFRWGGPLASGVYGPFHGWFSTLTSIAFGPEGDLFVADFYDDRVQKFAPDGRFLTSFGGTGAGAGELHHAIAVAVAGDGSVFVADFLNARIQEWRPRR